MTLTDTPAQLTMDTDGTVWLVIVTIVLIFVSVVIKQVGGTWLCPSQVREL